MLVSAEAEAPREFTVLNSSAKIISGAFLGESTLYEIELSDQTRWRALRHETGQRGFNDAIQVKLAVAPRAWAVVPE